MNSETLYLNWNFGEITAEKVERYCHNCGKKVLFSDSLVRRQNANGKNIHHYAIYKCERGHTWNRKIEQFKAVCNLENKVEVSPEVLESSDKKPIELLTLYASGYREVRIRLIVKSKIRIDKLLSEQIEDLSRNQLNKWFDKNKILLDNQFIKHSQKIIGEHTLSILL